MRLENGERLRNARLCYQVVGTPNRARDNLVLIPSYYGGTHWGSLPCLVRMARWQVAITAWC